MLAIIQSTAVFGIDSYLVRVEVDISGGLPSYSTVGLPDVAVKENKDRVKAAVKNSNFEFPSNRITVNLSPADIKKEGPAFDLPIAIGILAATGQLKSEKLKEYAILGELSLDGTVQKINGVLPIALGTKREGLKGLILPHSNSDEAGVVEGIDVIPVKDLFETVKFLEGEKEILPHKVDLNEIFNNNRSYELDFSDVKGQEQAKRALEVAAAGGHNVVMVGPPGSGKTMLAQRFPTILPDINLEEALETTKIHSVAGILVSEKGLISARPFRSPHHTISSIALTGGGQYPRPGEVSLAHHGVLFLDELPEFSRGALEILRQPLEDGVITISRAAASLTYPARFMLTAAMNPCPCGYYGDSFHECKCSPNQVYKYRSKVSGPLLDRIDIHLDVPAVKFKDISSKVPAESSEDIKFRINKARDAQKDRFKNHKKIFCNAHMGHRDIKKYCEIDENSLNLLKGAIQKMGFSARAYDRILKVSRTIADLEGTETIQQSHILEAIQYRSLDRGGNKF
ncbi:MAG: YifB family Mg chelatase-like AAA ATPase [bacterium]